MKILNKKVMMNLAGAVSKTIAGAIGTAILIKCTEELVDKVADCVIEKMKNSGQFKNLSVSKEQIETK